ncbi:achacin-like [Mytilus galloprovincialis]|uniref:achacin-like n=1 Tax=Mytilus galloprovincialis TaxID=29158 RepID=UPI003F7CB62B
MKTPPVEFVTLQGCQTLKSALGYTKRCDDVAIIGAGIAGTYSGWRLRNLNQKITIYEYSDRVGGRCYTLQFPEIPDINVELGALRFKPKSHKLLHDTIRKLGLRVEKFELGIGPSNDTIVAVRGTHLRHQDLGGFKTPYILHSNERKPVDQLKWEMFRNNTDVLTTNVPEDVKRFYIKDVDGIEIYKQSITSLYNKFLTPEAQKYIRETSGFAEYDISAAVQVVDYPPSNEESEVLTVTKGFQSIPTTLLERFLNESRRLVV